VDAIPTRENYRESVLFNMGGAKMIIRNKNRETFTVISNQAINDPQLSDKALGTLVRLLSKPDNWNLNINYIVKTGKQGRTAIRSSIAELEKGGYIHKQVVRTKSGRITGTEYHVYEDAGARKDGVTTAKVSPNVGQPLIHNEVPEQATTSQVKTDIKDETQSSETRRAETVPVINTYIEQTLRETTTTAPEPEVEVEVLLSSSYPATEDINSLLNLIPEQHSQPMMISLVNKSAKEYSALEMEEAITYATANVKGGAMQ